MKNACFLARSALTDIRQMLTDGQVDIEGSVIEEKGDQLAAAAIFSGQSDPEKRTLLLSLLPRLLALKVISVNLPAIKPEMKDNLAKLVRIIVSIRSLFQDVSTTVSWRQITWRSHRFHLPAKSGSSSKKRKRNAGGQLRRISKEVLKVQLFGSMAPVVEELDGDGAFSAEDSE